MRWAELQQAFAQHLLSTAQPPASDSVLDEQIDAPVRLSIYHHNVRATLQDSLQETYQAVYQLVGDDYFAALAQAYAKDHAPESGNLAEYGAPFADWLHQHPASEQLPYLPDVARFEWAWQRCFYAPESPEILDLSRLDHEALLRSTLTFRPDTKWVQLSYPAAEIWQFCLSDSQETLSAPDISSGRYAYLLVRDHGRVRIHDVTSPDLIHALDRLDRGLNLQQLIEEQPDVALADLLALLMQHSLVTKIQNNEGERT